MVWGGESFERPLFFNENFKIHAQYMNKGQLVACIIIGS